jgi:hypothetical protein
VNIPGEHKYRGWNKKQAQKSPTDDVISICIRERDKDLPCIVCGKFKEKYDCGHFMEREFIPTRYHPYNLNAECVGDNRQDGMGYGKDKGFLYGMRIDEKYGSGCALFLYNLSKEHDEFTPDEMTGLRAAARKGSNVYEAYYFEIRPRHKFIPKSPSCVA